MAIPLEDNFTDIIGKAQRGLLISESQLAQKSGVTADEVHAVREGRVKEDAIRKIAGALQLDAETLVALACEKWKPGAITLDGLAQFNTKYHDMTVNAYLVWDKASGEAVAFDTGADCAAMLKRAQDEKVRISLILLTHAHPDHVEDLAKLKRETNAPVYISDREPMDGAELIKEGKKFRVGALEIEALSTWGHSPGGMTFFVRGLAQPVAIVGDSIFAGSMGGGNVSYSEALRNNRDKILTLPNETILCPGHGPLTTVANENAHNPFFAKGAR